MSLPESTTVLIVGGGPTGVTTALSLIHNGCRDLVIVDAVAQGANSSRAMVIHAATLEALDGIGCAEGLVSLGVKAGELNYNTLTSKLFYADFKSLARYTKYPFMLLIPQPMTEHVLTQKLHERGINIYRPYKVAGMRQNAQDKRSIDVLFEDGQVVKTRYVIGADGAHSIIRTMSGINYVNPQGRHDGPQHLKQMVMADVTFESLPKAGMQFFLAEQGFFAVVPLPNSYKDDQRGSDILYRILCGVPAKAGEVPSAPPKDYLQKLIDINVPHAKIFDVDSTSTRHSSGITQVFWSSRFKTNSAIADRFFTRFGSRPDGSSAQADGGVVLLVGDAAHIHSPAGGQGLNLGVLDALALGKAVSEHIRAAKSAPGTADKEPDSILHSYSSARRTRALDIISLTTRLLGVLGASNDGWYGIPMGLRAIRDWVVWFIGRFSFARTSFAWRLSGLDHTHTK